MPAYIFLHYFLIGGKLFYNVMVASGIQQQFELAIIIHISSGTLSIRFRHLNLFLTSTV